MIDSGRASKIAHIRAEPNCVKGSVTGGMHESLLRAFQILEVVKDYLARDIPAGIMLELIKEMEDGPSSHLDLDAIK